MGDFHFFGGHGWHRLARLCQWLYWRVAKMAFFWHGFSFDLLSIGHVLLGTWDRVIYCKTNRLECLSKEYAASMIRALIFT